MRQNSMRLNRRVSGLAVVLLFGGLFAAGLLLGSVSGWLVLSSTRSAAAKRPTPLLPLAASAPTQTVPPADLVPTTEPAPITGVTTLPPPPLPYPQQARFRLGSGRAMSVDFSPAGDQLAVGTTYGLRLYSFPALVEQWYSGPDLQPSRTAFSSNGKLLAAGTQDNKVLVWDLATHKQLLSLAAGDAYHAVLDLVFLADGKHLFARSNGGELRVWSLADGSSVWLEDLKNDLTAMRTDISPSGYLAIAQAEAPGVRVIDVRSGVSLNRIEQAENRALATVAISPGGDRFAYADYQASSTIRILPVGKDAPPLDLPGHASPVTGLTFSRDGGLLAAASQDGVVRVWQTSTGRLASDLKSSSFVSGRTRIDSLTFSPDSTWVQGAASQQNQVFLWNVLTAMELKLIYPSAGRQSNSVLSPDSRYLVYTPYNQPVTILDLSGGGPERYLNIGLPAYRAAFWPGADTIAASFGQGLILYDAASGSPKNARIPRGAPAALAFLPAGVPTTPLDTQGQPLFLLDPPLHAGSLIGRWPDLSLGIWSTASQAKAAVRLPNVHDYALAPDGKSIAYIDGNQDLVLANAPTGEHALHLQKNCDRVAFSPDSSTLAAACAPNQINLYSSSTRTLSGSTSAIDQPHKYLSFSPDGKKLMLLYDQFTWYWEPHSGQNGRQLNVATQSEGVRYASVGLLSNTDIIIGDTDGNIFFIDPASGKRRRVLTGHRQSITSLALSPDGKSLLSSSWDGTVLLWKLP